MSTVQQLEQNAPSTRMHSDGYSLEYDDSGAVAMIRFWFENQDLLQFRKTVCGLPETFQYPGGSSVTRIIPLVHPDTVNCPNCFASSVKIYPASKTVTFGKVKDDPDCHLGDFGAEIWLADVNFRTATFGLSGDTPLITSSIDIGAEAITRPGSCYKFPSDGFPVKHNVAVKIPTIQYSMTFHRLPSINTTIYEALVGMVNITPFLNRPVGTVRFDGLSSQGEQTVGGVVSYDATVKVAYRRLPWNQIMRADGGGFEVTQPYIYEPGELNDLFY